MIALWLWACTGNLSNTLFIEDSTFRAALPRWDALDPTYPSGLAQAQGQPLHLGAWTQGALALTAQLQGGLDDALGPAASQSPAERGEDWRRWGPYTWDAAPGSFLTLEMSRTTDRALYSYGAAASTTSAGPYTEVLSGTWAAGVDPEGWQGRVAWDWDTLATVLGTDTAGHLSLAWRVDEPALLVEASGARFGAGVDMEDYRLQVELPAVGGGVLALETRADLVPGALGVEVVELDARWDTEGGGRGVAQVDGGDLGVDGNLIAQCWDADGALLWQQDERGWLPAQGDEGDCSLAR